VAQRTFAYRRLHSLLGIIPIGVFLIQHLLINYFAVYGEERFNGAVAFMENLPLLIVLEIVLIYLPLLYHAILGTYIAFTSKNSLARYGYFRNWMFDLQRLTGLIAFAFIAWHVWQTRIQIGLGNAELNYGFMAGILASPVAFWLYAISILAISFHFSNGLWSFLVTWGITQSARSQKAATYVTLALFAGVAYVGIRALVRFSYGI